MLCSSEIIIEWTFNVLAGCGSTLFESAGETSDKGIYSRRNISKLLTFSLWEWCIYHFKNVIYMKAFTTDTMILKRTHVGRHDRKHAVAHKI